MSGLLRKIGRSRVVKLEDGRLQVTDRFEIRGDASDPTNLATLFLAYRTAHPKYTTCLLAESQVVSGSPDQGIEQELVRVYFEPGPTTATAIKFSARLVFPFKNEGDYVTAEIHQDYLIDTPRYAAPTLSVAYSNEADLSPQPSGAFYLVGDYNHRDASGGSTRFTRIWSMIPATRDWPGGSISWRRPGLTVGTSGSPVSISSINFTTVTFTTGSAHGLSAGQWAFIDFEYTYTLGATTKIRFSGYASVATAPTTTTLTLNIVLYTNNLGTYAFTSGTITRADPARYAQTVSASTILRHEYALAGVTSGITVPQDFRRAVLFEPTDTTGLRTDIVGPSTIPTVSDYRTMVTNKVLLRVESYVRPYKGAILERLTVQVPAE